MGHKITSLLNSATWSGAIFATAGAFTLNQWLAIGGFALALGGFGVNAWHKITMVKLKKRELDMKR